MMCATSTSHTFNRAMLLFVAAMAVAESIKTQATMMEMICIAVVEEVSVSVRMKLLNNLQSSAPFISNGRAFITPPAFSRPAAIGLFGPSVYWECGPVLVRNALGYARYSHRDISHAVKSFTGVLALHRGLQLSRYIPSRPCSRQGYMGHIKPDLTNSGR